MSLPEKEIECVCGNVMMADSFRVWCRKCGKPVYYEKKDQTRHKLNSIYMFLAFIGSITFLVYAYLELIARHTFD
jgi:predicted nucleic acid-binding Zn ribbon protein